MENFCWNWERIEHCIGQKSGLNDIDLNGVTALYFVCTQDFDKHLLNRMIDAGANVNICCGQEQKDTPLLLASKNGAHNTAKILLKHGANPNVYSDSGNTTLTYASREGSIEFLKYLIDSGADVNMQNQDGTTALMHATFSYNLKKVRLLINSGAHIALQQDEQSNALISALDYQFTEIIDYFISLDPDINPLITYKNFEFYFKSSMSFRNLIEKKLHTLNEENLQKWKTYRLKTLFV